MAKKRRGKRIKNFGKPEAEASPIRDIIEIKPREPNGRHKRGPRDDGPSDATKARLIVIADVLQADWRDPKINTVLGRLYLSQRITDQQMRAGERYVQVVSSFQRSISGPRVPCLRLMDRVGGAEPDRIDGWEVEARRQYMDMREALGKRPILNMILDRTCLYDCEPATWAMDNLRERLDVLAAHFF